MFFGKRMNPSSDMNLNRTAFNYELRFGDQCNFHVHFLVLTKKDFPVSASPEISQLPSSLLSSCPQYPFPQYCYSYRWMQYPHTDPLSIPFLSSNWTQYPTQGVFKTFKSVLVPSPQTRNNNGNSSLISSHPLTNSQPRIIENSISPSNSQTKRTKQLFKVNRLNPKTDDPFLNANYRYRNVFKAIIRRMYTYARKKKRILTPILQSAGYSLGDIEHAYIRITYYKNAERKSGKKRMPVRTIKDATQDLSIYTYILKDVLSEMLKDWEARKFGRLAERNVGTYKRVCSTYLEQIEKLLTKQN